MPLPLDNIPQPTLDVAMSLVSDPYEARWEGTNLDQPCLLQPPMLA